jgi:hypothetical protein
MPFAAWLGQILAPIIAPIVKAAVKEAWIEITETRAVVGRPDADLQRLWSGGADPAGHGNAAGKAGKG